MMTDDRKPSYEEIEKKLEAVQNELESLKIKTAEFAGLENPSFVSEIFFKRFKHISKILHAIRDVHRLIAVEDNPFKLIQVACETLTRTLGYFSAWIALIDEKTEKVTGLALSGFEGDVSEFRRNLEKGHYPVCMVRCIEESGINVVLDPLSKCKDCLISTEYSGKSGLSLKLFHGDRVFGVFCVSVPKSYVTDPDEQALFLELARDISFALNRIEEGDRLKEEQERIVLLSHMLDISPVAIAIIDVSGRFLYTNRTNATLYGYDDEKEFLSMNICELSTPETAALFEERVKEVVLKGTARFEVTRMKKDGTILFLDVFGKSFFWEGRPAVLNIATDITERKNLEAQLLHAQKMESVGRLAGGVAHDFNNMLGVILGHAEMAITTVASDDPLREDLKEILNAAMRSADITRQLLAFACKQTISPKVIDLNEAIEGMFKFLRRLIGEDVDLIWAPGSKLKPVRMDPAQIDQILANLCINAKDAINGVGRLSIKTGSLVLERPDPLNYPEAAPGEYVVLKVSDNGCGMDRDTVKSAFEPFFTTKEQGRGTGLGLSTVYGIVRQNGGFINLHSTPGKGSVFKIGFPASKEKSTDIIPVRGGSDLQPSDNEIVLLVEDEQAILKMTSKLLEKLGYKVLTASKPDEAFDHISKYGNDIKLLITDVVMPDMNGKDLAAALQKDSPGLLCLFMSGYTADVIARHGILEEGVRFIQKPFTKKELAGKVRELLDENNKQL